MRTFNKPHPKQLEWLYGKPGARIRLALAGVQGGKTEIGCRKFAQDLRNTRNGYFMVVAPTYKILTQATMVKLQEVLDIMSPKTNWIVKKNERDKMYWLDVNNNMIYMRSAENPDYLRGPTLNGAFFDECAIVGNPAPFRILRQRVNVRRGPIYLTTTPQGANWLVREIINPWKAGDPMYHVVNWPSYMNPAFDKAEYERAKKYEDDRWVRQEYEGLIEVLGGMVFPEFAENIHMAELSYNPNLPIYWGVDFGIANPTYIGFWQVEPEKGPHGRISQLAELSMRNLKTEDVILHALNSEEPVNYSAYRFPEYACCDPSGKYREKVAGIGSIDVMMQLGIACVYEPDWNQDEQRSYGIREMHRYLNAEMIQFDANKCWNMINAFGLYSRPPQKEGERAQEMPTKDGRSDHCMESAFYFLLGKPYYDNTERGEDINEIVKQAVEVIKDDGDLQEELENDPFDIFG